MDDAAPKLPTLLTTREVADLLRVKERKVYDLAAAGEIPHRRLTGKLLFPADELAVWIDAGRGGPAQPRPAVLAGSHDPLLDWAVRESGSGLASLTGGSLDGLERFRGGEAALAALHVPEADGDFNIATVAAAGLSGAVLIAFAARVQGLLLSSAVAGRVASIGDLAGLRVLMRQPGAGGRALFDRLAGDAGLDPAAIEPAASVARTESDLGAAIASGEADAALGLEAVARQYRLDFVPLATERFDLLVDRRSYFTGPVQRLLDFLRGSDCDRKAAALGGYDLGDTGRVRWLSD